MKYKQEVLIIIEDIENLIHSASYITKRPNIDIRQIDSYTSQLKIKLEKLKNYIDIEHE